MNERKNAGMRNIKWGMREHENGRTREGEGGN